MNAAQNPLNICPYWVGDILTTMSEIAPAQRWPGTSWVQITDCMIRAADESHPAGSTGGAWEVKQTVEQVPSHHHSAYYAGIKSESVDNSDFGTYVLRSVGRADVAGGGATERVADTGGNQPMPIVNKYTAFYIWQRTG